MQVINSQDKRELLLSIIEKVIYEGGKNNFAIIPANAAYYLQIAAARGDYDLYCEAVSNNYLEGEDMLVPAQEEQLAALGWYHPQSAAGNFYLHHPVNSETARIALAELFEQTLLEVYHASMINTDYIIVELQA